ncbi:TorF family putative porin [Asticcacaulis endophyticus]|uniref:DUF2490 domain-containing protein n=1 Tax=Asticcacaulis endophyticus TaxID=1395890 RepID=A0A918Q3P9_9CAUL|nr:porin [Asticcacaulis endophyticus]GGZ32793.1 hypothetical protein GCM10011273_18820 [Asticcacaulis endophyticus]
MSNSVILRALMTSAVVVSALSLTPFTAMAETSKFKFSGQINALSDGIYRGVSQTEGLPQYTAGAQVAYGKFFAGTLFKTMRDRATGVDNQIQWLVGYKTKFKGTDITARAIYKQYNGIRVGTDNEFIEYEINAAHKLAKNTTGRLTLAYSPDNYGKAKEATYAEIGLDQQITPKFTVMVANGFRHNENSVDYTSYLAGGRYALTKTLNASLTFTTTDKGKFADKYDDSVFITLSQKF